MVKAIDAGKLDWNIVMAQAHQGMVLPLLYKSLVQKQLIDRAPDEVGQALEGFFDLNVVLNGRLRSQVQAITACLNQNGIAHVWLKGATHLLRTDWRQSPRTMLDIDVWIPNQDQHEMAFKKLAELGYESVSEKDGHVLGNSHQYPPLVKKGESARLEFHASLVNKKYASLLPDRPSLDQVQWLKWAGERVGVLSLLDQAMHAYIQCVHMSGNQFLTEHVTLMKTQDFVERLTLAGPAALNSESFCRLHQQPWSDSANMFFTYLRHAFGVASNFKKNAMYSGRQGNPALASVAKTQDFYQRIQNSIREGRIGPLHELPIRIWRNLRYILLAKDI